MARQKVERTDLLKKTISLLQNQGYHNTSMADIATVCTMSKAGLYHHFDSKLHLVTAALVWVQQDFIEKVLVHADNELIAPRDRFLAVLNAAEHYLLGTAQREGGCLMASISLETSGKITEFAEVISVFFDNWIDTYQRLLQSVFVKEDAKVLAQSAVAQTQGALLLSQVYNDSTHLRRVCRDLVQCWDKQVVLNNEAMRALSV